MPFQLNTATSSGEAFVRLVQLRSPVFQSAPLPHRGPTLKHIGVMPSPPRKIPYISPHLHLQRNHKSCSAADSHSQNASFHTLSSKASPGRQAPTFIALLANLPLTIIPHRATSSVASFRT
ncbi:hypothetical protein E4U11_007373 [Claviceps purpurea]|nr:hypothetical protein E4U11_007373 [Claviceps purpurea]